MPSANAKVTIFAIIVFALICIPNLPNSAGSRNNGPIAIYEPALTDAASLSTPNMPLPAPAYATSPVPVSGVLRVLVIAAEFPDVPHTLSIDTIRSEWVNQVAKYYEEDSLGAVSLSVSVFGWFKLPYNEAHYGANCGATGAINDAGCTGEDASWNIAQDASTLVRNNVTFADYDYYVFIHSGDGQESSGNSNDVWSVTYLAGVWVNACLDVQENCNQKTLTRFNIDPELEAGGAVPIGVYCHEFAHNLGLPDLYNTNNGKTILGPWSLMDKGLWNGNPMGSTPSHMDAWSKIQLGFFSTSMIANANAGVTSTFTIAPTEVPGSNTHAVIVPINSNVNPSQYYIIEARSRTGFDSALPSAGVILLYVDTSLSVGKVQLVNTHPSIANLSEAPWNVGETFTDSKNGWSMTVTGQTANTYQVAVNRGGTSPPPNQPQNQNQNQTQTFIDLAITSISAAPQVITLANTTVTITVEIANTGTQAANDVPIAVDLDTLPYTSLQSSIGAGETEQSNFTWISTAGAHTFKVIIDPDNTMNNTNQTNNSATFTLNVGPTLTINVPFNLTSDGNIWVKINGAQYNLTSNQLQTSVPNATVTVEIQPVINISQGIRETFSAWTDGNTSNPRQIAVTSGTILQALYTTQYLLNVNANGGTTTPGGWYAPNSTVTVTANNPSNMTANASRYLFSSWSGDSSSNSTIITFTMAKPVTLQANWLKQYYVTIISAAGSPAGQGWYNAGTVVTVGVQPTVQYTNGTKMIFDGWNATALGDNPSAQITVNSPIGLRAAWKTQYLLTVESAYGTPAGGGWYDAGSSVQASVPAQIVYANATRIVFTGWTGDYSSASNNVTFKLDSPKTLTAQWTTQYLVTLAVSGLPNSTVLKLNLNNAIYDLPAGTTYQTWIQRGTAINPSVNATVASGITAYKFSGWRNTTGSIVQTPMAVNAPSTYFATYTNELGIPAIPGFPLEGIILGVLFGSWILVTRRRKGVVT